MVICLVPGTLSGVNRQILVGAQEKCLLVASTYMSNTVLTILHIFVHLLCVTEGKTNPTSLTEEEVELE